MNKYKLICCDLDGTLLNSKSKMEAEAIKLLRTLQGKGVYVAITTGRAGFDAKSHAELISEQTYFMGSNGAIVGIKDEIINESSMSKDEKNKIFDLISTHRFEPIFVTQDRIYVYHWAHYIFHKFFYHRGRPSDVINYVPHMADLKKIVMADTCKVHKVITLPKWKKSSKRLKESIKTLKTFELAITPGNVFEITGQGISKGRSVKILAAYLDIDISEVIAFGDSQNDIDMLKTVGLGVAMDNASDEVKSIADRVTRTNNDKGVVSVLREVFEYLDLR